MRKSICLFLALILAIALTGSAAYASAVDARLPGLLSAARTLLFDTSNVTISGHADFLYNGERFKTADILYKQDGFNSHWQLDLLTPRAYRPDQETGYTVIANNEWFYVIERFHPGVYRMGADIPCDSLLRRTVRSDSLLTLASASAGAIESLLPEGSITVVSDSADGCELRITLVRGDAPDLLNSSLNLAAGYVLQRFMGLDYGHIWSGLHGHIEDYVTVTQGILYTTESFVLGDTDVTIRVDAQNRLNAASGSVTAMLYSGEGVFSPLTINFSLDFTDYGSSIVRKFDPEAFHVVSAESGTAATPAPEMDPLLKDKLTARAREILSAAGIVTDGSVEIRESDDVCSVYFIQADSSSSVTVSMNKDGTFMSMADGRDAFWSTDPRQPTITALPENAVVLLKSFLEKEAPDQLVRCKEFIPGMEYDCDGVLYEFVSALDENGNDTDIYFTVQIGTSPKIVSAGVAAY